MPGNDSPAGREAAGRSRPASVAYAARRTARDEQGAETVASRGGKPSDTRLKVLDRILFEHSTGSTRLSLRSALPRRGTSTTCSRRAARRVDHRGEALGTPGARYEGRRGDARRP